MNILLDRANPKAAYEAIQKACLEMEKGTNVVIFPEGTIPKTVPQMKVFKNGAFKVSVQMKLPILPITFKDNYKRLEDSWKLAARSGPGKARVIIHQPIQVSESGMDDLVTLQQRTKEVIASEIE